MPNNKTYFWPATPNQRYAINVIQKETGAIYDPKEEPATDFISRYWDIYEKAKQKHYTFADLNLEEPFIPVSFEDFFNNFRKEVTP